jgi:NitT/TauT family transport system permease protein
MPAFASSLRQGFSFAWRSLMGAELIFMVKGQGIGYLLHQGREFSDIAQVIATMIVMIAFGMVFDLAAFAPLERRVHSRFGLLGTR